MQNIVDGGTKLTGDEYKKVNGKRTMAGSEAAIYFENMSDENRAHKNIAKYLLNTILCIGRYGVH